MTLKCGNSGVAYCSAWRDATIYMYTLYYKYVRETKSQVFDLDRARGFDNVSIVDCWVGCHSRNKDHYYYVSSTGPRAWTLVTIWPQRLAPVITIFDGCVCGVQHPPPPPSHALVHQRGRFAFIQPLFVWNPRHELDQRSYNYYP